MSQAGMELQDLISSLGSGNDWQVIDQLTGMLGHPERKARAEQDAARQQAKIARFQSDLLVVFSTPEGGRVLNELLDGTLRKPPVALATMGLTSDQLGIMAAYREGQNSIIYTLLKSLEQAGFDPSTNGDAA